MASIIRRPDGHCVYDDKGQRIAGPFKTEEEATAHVATLLPKKKGTKP